MNDKWMLHRAGLLNFWYYDEEYFDFADGKLLLRGTNGSGKSVTMQSFLPVLLDGKKSPDRLDPFGSKARRMEDYLLGEKEVVDRDERTGYLFLEYKRQHSNQYITTGIGLRAKRQKNMEFWGFAILDNRRVGKDFFLYKEEKTGVRDVQKIPLTKKELENRLGAGGAFAHTQGEYMELVNKYVFGFETTEAFDELIKLLIQLRSPKLSKDFKPTVIYEILEAALPPLSDDDLRQLSDTIENMDQAKQQLEQLEKDKRALERLCKEYTVYNEFQLADKAEYYLKHERQVSKLEEDAAAAARKEQELKDGLQRLRSQERQLGQEQDVFKKEQQELFKHEVFDLEEKYAQEKENLRRLLETVRQRTERIDAKRRKERTLADDIRTSEYEVVKYRDSIGEHLEELDAAALESSFLDHEMNKSDFLRKLADGFDFSVWIKETEAYQALLAELVKIWERHDQARDRYQTVNREYGEINKELDALRHDENKWKRILEEEKTKFQQAVYAWSEQHPQLAVEEAAFQQFLHRLTDLYEAYSFEELKSPFTQQYHNAVAQLQKHQAEAEQRIEAKVKEINEAKQEWQAWRDKKDPEPKRHPQTEQVRAQLEKEGIAYVPLYAAIEFRDHVQEEVRERIESALAQMGLLDALITKDSKAIVFDRVIEPKPQMLAHTLADYVKPDVDGKSAISAEMIDDVLRSIVMDEADGKAGVTLQKDGTYQIGLLKGQPPLEKQALFIGKTARVRYRLTKLAELEEKLGLLQQELAQLSAVKEQAVQQDKLLRAGYESFPGDKDMRAAFGYLRETGHKIQHKEEEVQKKNTVLGEAHEHWRGLLHELQLQTAPFNIEFSRESYEQAQTEMRLYVKELNEVKLVFAKLRAEQDKLRLMQGNLEELEQEIDLEQGNLAFEEDQRDKKQLEIQRLEERLQDTGAEDIRKRIRDVQQRLHEIKVVMPKIQKDTLQAEHDLQGIMKKQSELQEALALAQQLRLFAEQLFAEELKYKFVQVEQEGVLKAARDVVKIYGQRKGDDRVSAISRLTSVFHRELAQLVEYRMTQEETKTAFINEIPVMPDDDLRRKELLEKTARLTILLDYKGQRVSPYYVLTEMEQDLLRQQAYLNEQDRELYEEVILKSVGRTLRGRISRAERWVKEMNALMQKRNPSSGLLFSIKWRPRTAETEEELDTKDLVELLRMNSRLLKEEDLMRVTKHFRSKISRAREMIEERGQGNTLHQVIKEVLDYRKWFAFTLYYEKTNEPKRELTNQQFFKFSGGEKAMAMYIPLFTAAYSRYQEASLDAPHIISLDEAFAGVDENNIRDMFELVEELGFNFIMNSQALWGDYDTVPALSICELVRPKNAPYVTVIRYIWDGNVKRVVFDTEEGKAAVH
ncbi:MAG: TIGR02680 family protein [Ectobacillus sp.]